MTALPVPVSHEGTHVFRMRSLPLILSIASLSGLFGKSHATFCVSQGAGSCQLDFTGHPVYSNNGFRYAVEWETASIFDHSCKLLGNVSKPLKNMSIYSALPFAIVLTWIETDTQYFEFCYAGTCHDGGFWCSSQDENSSTTIECIHAFDCASMDRLVSSS